MNRDLVYEIIHPLSTITNLNEEERSNLFKVIWAEIGVDLQQTKELDLTLVYNTNDETHQRIASAVKKYLASIRKSVLIFKDGIVKDWSIKINGVEQEEADIIWV